ncbi:MAG: hypothetical protein IPM54_26175 [Polyangiaceae bacterium]|nr:hypothetical protein [Polyangiaceae bacterium]
MKYGTLFAFGLLFALRPGCGPFKPEKSEKRPATELPKHCASASSSCYDGCYKRQEGEICTSCCFENLILCGEGHPSDFKKCDTIERETR